MIQSKPLFDLDELKKKMPEMPWVTKAKLMKHTRLTSEECNMLIQNPKILECFIRIKRDVLKEFDKDYK